MKRLCSPFPPQGLHLAVCLGLTIGYSSFAQSLTDFYSMPVVSIFATQPLAVEPNMPGQFTLFRFGPINSTLTVFYQISGTASNGVDYAALPGSVTIPAGALMAPIVVSPINDAAAEELLETVALRLVPPPTVPPAPYSIGFPSSATVYILDDDFLVNFPPMVGIVQPTNNAVFPAPAQIKIVADTVDADGYVTKVEFFEGTRKIGEETKLFFVAPTNGSHIAYEFQWTNVPPGLYRLSARATDNVGATAFSQSVNMAVTGTNPPPTNLPPVVTIFASDPIAAEGTDTVSFVVLRSGATNSSLTVPYAIGGTASNGVDYLAIPNSVTIPPGQRSASITITPIDDAIPECVETVVLRLLQPAGTPPPYLVSWPGIAAAVIVDNDQPPPGTCVLCDGLFHLCLPATNGFSYRLECSADLTHWMAVCTNTVTVGAIHFTDPETPNFPSRFYRVVLGANQPRN